MPSFTFIVEDTSPMLVYSAENWRAGTSETDSSLDQYTQSSFILTQTVGATLSFKFYGTSIQIAGAKRSNHGNYQIQLDGGSVSTFNGESDTAVFNQTLYSSSVTLGSHQLTVTNAGGSSTANSFLDLDYVAFQTSVGKDDENLIVNTFQDTHPSFIYTPSSSWNVIPDSVGAFSGSSGHATRDPSASAKFTFQGDAVALYGPVGPNNSLSYSVQVDGGSPSVFSAEKQVHLPQQLLFYAGNLGAGQHSLQIQTGSSGTGELAIDFANVYTTPSLGGSAPSIAPATIGRIPAGVIAALSMTSTIAIIATIACIYLVWRQRRELLGMRYPVMTEKPGLDTGFVEPYRLSPFAEMGATVERSQSFPSQARSSFSSPPRESQGDIVTPLTESLSYVGSSSGSIAPRSTSSEVEKPPRVLRFSRNSNRLRGPIMEGEIQSDGIQVSQVSAFDTSPPEYSRDPGVHIA